jgi:ribonuclease P protein component
MKIYLTKHDQREFKLLIIVSKKISKRAHERNRIKRKIQGIFEPLYREGRLPPGVSCAIQIMSSEVIHMSSQDLKEYILPKVSTIYSKM